MINLILFLCMLVILAKSAYYATVYSSRLAKTLHITEFLTSFLIVAVISTFPETTISIISALKGIPELGLGTLLGSNVADLTLVLAVVILFSKTDIKLKSQILKKSFVYLFLLALPVLLGLDSKYSRFDGILLIFGCIVFFYYLYKTNDFEGKKQKNNHKIINLLLLILSLAFLLTSAYYTVHFGVNFANDIGIPPFLVGLLIISLGTCLPELFYSIGAVRKKHNSLALGDLLGTVIIDSTLIIGIISLISPFAFNISIIYTAGLGMFLAGLLTLIFLKVEKKLTKKDAIYLLLFYIAYIVIELLLQKF